MKVSIKTIKITSVISALSLVIALLMGAEYFKDASQIYLFGISWVTLQNTAFGIFGSAALAAVSAGIIYGVDKEAYLNKSEQYLIHVCTKSKTAFVPRPIKFWRMESFQKTKKLLSQVFQL